MLTKPRRIRILPDSELGRVLDEVGETPVLLEKNGRVYRLTEEEADLWDTYDAEKAKETLQRVAGSWADVDIDALILSIYRGRQDGSRPAERP